MLYIEDMCIPIPQFLKDNNFIIPKICIFKDENLEVAYEKNNIVQFTMYIHNDKSDRDGVMWYYPNHTMGKFFYPQYDLSYGHVILTGLGMNMSPNWISTKPEVSKVTVIENNKYIIDYIKKYGFIDDKVEIIHGDAEKYIGKCDVFIHDHNYGEMYSLKKRLNTFDILDNIECDLIWSQRVTWQLSKYSYNNYLILKENNQKLPNLSKEKFDFYCKLRKSSKVL